MRLQEMAYFALEVLDRLHHTGGVVDLGVGWEPRDYYPHLARESD